MQGHQLAPVGPPITGELATTRAGGAVLAGALLLFIQSSEVRPFVLALLIGIVSGTYSSIFNASPILVTWHEWEQRRREKTLAGRSPRRAAT